MHEHTHKTENKNLLITVVLNFIISAAELAGGLLSNSLALVSDALHNFSDGFAVLVTFITNRISRRDPNFRKTFGYKRIQILSALFNALVLTGICIFLVYESIIRLNRPVEIKSLVMIAVATIGLLANIAGVFLLRKHSVNNINIRSAYLHLIGDTLSSVAVIIGGILIYFRDIYWLDPLITILISLYIIKETYSIILETYNILMQGTPRNMDILKITEAIYLLPEVKGIHHIHVWNLSDQDIHFEAHIDLNNDIKISESEYILRKIEQLLLKQFGISHVTLQMEYDFCDLKNLIETKKYQM